MEKSKFYQIKNITEREYTLVGCDGSVITRPIQDVDKSASAFTIQDAKDGDVLVCKSGWTCIFKTLVNDETFSSYCFMDNTKWFCETGSECHTLKEEFVKAYNGKIYPATKEQRDILFAKMKEAGYEWDAEKKKLKKIEQKPAAKYKVGDTVYYDSFGRLVSFIIANIIEDGTDNPMYEDKDGNSIFQNDIVEQKPIWSEKDEYILFHAINDLKFLKDTISIDPKYAVNIIDVEREINLLKSIKDRVQPQPKQEWSEEDDDDAWLNDIISKAECNLQLNKGEINWLKSLKERYTWKPSDEHYELEEFAKIVRSNLTGINKSVQELFEAKYLQLTGSKMYEGFKD